MCTAQEEQLIRNELDQWITSNKMFTSVDIANAIKESGEWIRNREVAGYLRNNACFVASVLLGKKYIATQIDVDVSGTPGTTTLYHPVGDNPDNYTNRNQKAKSPVDMHQATTMPVTPPVLANLFGFPSTPATPHIEEDEEEEVRIPPTIDISKFRVDA
jgi:hypothetical protein